MNNVITKIVPKNAPKNALKFATLALAWLVTGCASVSPDYDAKFGDSVRAAQLAQTLHPGAGANPDAALGLDGGAAANGLERYQDSFKAPPKTFEVINIGGAFTGK
jgi:hypothetical protein